VHAAGTVFIPDLEALAIPLHAAGRAEVDDFGLNVESLLVSAMSTRIGDQLAAHIGRYGSLVDANLIPPGTDNGTIRAGNGRDTVAGAARRFEFEFIGKHGTVQGILIFLGDIVYDVLSVDTGPLASSISDTALRSPHVGAGTPQVHFQVMGQFIEDRFKLVGGGTQKNDVAGGTMQIRKAAALGFPEVAKLAEHFSVVKFACGLIHPHGVEMSDGGKKVRAVTVTANDASTIAEHADDAAMFPVPFLVAVGHFHQTQPVAAHRALISHSLDIAHKTRPWPLFQLIEQGSCMLLCHSINLRRPVAYNLFTWIRSYFADKDMRKSVTITSFSDWCDNLTRV